MTSNLESELAAARKVDDGEVAEALGWLDKPQLYPSGRIKKIAALVRQIYAALKEAERRAERAEKMHAEAFRIGIQHQEAAQAAEADCFRLGEEIAALRNDLAGARRDALEEAAKICDDGALIGDHPQRPSDWSRACREQARYIRALQTKDTTE